MQPDGGEERSDKWGKVSILWHKRGSIGMEEEESLESQQQQRQPNHQLQVTNNLLFVASLLAQLLTSTSAAGDAIFLIYDGICVSVVGAGVGAGTYGTFGRGSALRVMSASVGVVQEPYQQARGLKVVEVMVV